MADGTGLVKGLALTLAAGAGAGGGKLPKGRLLNGADLSASAAVRAGDNGSTRLSLIAVAVLADYSAGNGNFRFGPKGRFFKLNPKLIP